ncbi:zinc finger C2HC domain-containing protein 1C-like isoform X4 [Trichogramma pretiosum]|uniref:zinc finger C2HC domain-containing protein 1C-like isoform X4 n=1 Tax=Trichogramma pretiosum TaxID=7493 RepID=UPI0006C95DDE|nr:zinc finger C2HC domain-containing protein 1C-like isoform X4 [Trichogramma pretiosum]
MTKMPSVADAMDSRHDGYAMVKNRVSSSTKTSFAEIERVARFQQKQLQEKEHKLLQLYDQQQQRAHQVAQRGSAGSNGSSNGTSATNSLNKQRMFEDNNRRQANAKGIDKSYPLEPLSNGSKKQMTNGKSGSSKIASSSSNGTSSCRRGTLNGTSTVNNKRTTTTKTTGSTNGRSSVTVQQQRETTSYSTSRAIYRESVSQGEKKQNGTDEEQSSCNRRQSNGHNHYEINIDDVIDNEAMQRNRMLAKFNQSDIEKRRRRYSEEPNLLVEVRDGDAKSNGSNGDVATPTAPSKANGRRKIPSVSTPTTATTKNDESPSWRSKTRSTTSPAKSVDAADEGRLLSPTAASASRSSLDSATDETTDEKQSPSVQPAPRTSSLSSNSSIATNKSHGSAASAKAAAAAAASTASSRSTPTPAARTSPGGVKTSAQSEGSLNTCKICKRRFASDRIGLHEKICSKSATKKRKTFDTQTQRIKGTELEDYAPKLTTQSSNNSKKLQSKSQPQAPPKVESQKSNWRRKHEDFINAIRSAKQMQAHLAAGGKLSDLPPPPASDTSDYKQCPHCSRRFSPGAAERHIPKCETMQHNKPKVQPRTRSKII